MLDKVSIDYENGLASLAIENCQEIFQLLTQDTEIDIGVGKLLTFQNIVKNQKTKDDKLFEKLKTLKYSFGQGNWFKKDSLKLAVYLCKLLTVLPTAIYHGGPIDYLVNHVLINRENILSRCSQYFPGVIPKIIKMYKKYNLDYKQQCWEYCRDNFPYKSNTWHKDVIEEFFSIDYSFKIIDNVKKYWTKEFSWSMIYPRIITLIHKIKTFYSPIINFIKKSLNKSGIIIQDYRIKRLIELWEDYKYEKKIDWKNIANQMCWIDADGYKRCQIIMYLIFKVWKYESIDPGIHFYPNDPISKIEIIKKNQNLAKEMKEFQNQFENNLGKDSKIEIDTLLFGQVELEIQNQQNNSNQQFINTKFNKKELPHLDSQLLFWQKDDDETKHFFLRKYHFCFYTNEKHQISKDYIYFLQEMGVKKIYYSQNIPKKINKNYIFIGIIFFVNKKQYPFKDHPIYNFSWLQKIMEKKTIKLYQDMDDLEKYQYLAYDPKDEYLLQKHQLSQKKFNFEAMLSLYQPPAPCIKSNNYNTKQSSQSLKLPDLSQFSNNHFSPIKSNNTISSYFQNKNQRSKKLIYCGNEKS